MSLPLPAELSYLKIIPSYVCSRGCDYCYNVLLGQRTETAAGPLVESVLRTLREVPRPVHVELIGGEPLERPALAVTMELLERLSREPGCTAVVMSTAMVAPERLRPVLPLVERIYLSVDLSSGPGNRKRIHPDLLSRIAGDAGAAGVEVCLSTVLFGDESPDELADFIAAVEAAGITSVGFTHRTATPMTPDDIDTTVAQYHQLFRLRLRYRDRVAIVGSILDSVELYLRKGVRKAACECGRNSVVIEPDGTLSPGVCSDHRSGRYTLEEFTEIRLERPARLLSGVCGDCRLWNVCHGGCVTEAVRLSGTPFARAATECAILLGVAAKVDRDVAALASRRTA